MLLSLGQTQHPFNKKTALIVKGTLIRRRLIGVQIGPTSDGQVSQHLLVPDWTQDLVRVRYWQRVQPKSTVHNHRERSVEFNFRAEVDRLRKLRR